MGVGHPGAARDFPCVREEFPSCLDLVLCAVGLMVSGLRVSLASPCTTCYCRTCWNTPPVAGQRAEETMIFQRCVSTPCRLSLLRSPFYVIAVPSKCSAAVQMLEMTPGRWCAACGAP